MLNLKTNFLTSIIMKKILKSKKILFASLCIISICTNVLAQEHLANRYWLGILEEASLPLNLHFEVQDKDTVPMLYSPMQSNEKIAPSSFRIDADTLTISVKSLNMEARWIYNHLDSTFSGEMKQHGSKMHIMLKPSHGIYSPRRPQEPMPPFSYTEEEVVIANKKDGVTLHGTLTYPNSGSNFPVAILITGSGTQNRDEEIFKHKPFKVLADHLAKNGIATLRCDDRDFGKLSESNTTSFDSAKDIECQIKFLSSHPKIDKKRIGLIGHSEGAIIASIVAANKKTKVNFVVFLGGPGVDGKETLLLQNKQIFSLNGISDQLIDTRLAVLKEIFDSISTGKDLAIATTNSIVKKHAKGISKDDIKTIGLNPKGVIALTYQLKSNWMKTFLNLDPCPYLGKIKCPILALNGEKDCQVLPNENLKAIERCTNGNAKTMIIPDLNHLFQTCQTGSPDEYMFIEETFSPTALNAISDWIFSYYK